MKTRGTIPEGAGLVNFNTTNIRDGEDRTKERIG
jgi:hypothetical protein